MDGLLSDQTILEIKSTKSGLDLLFVERLEAFGSVEVLCLYVYEKSRLNGNQWAN